MCRAAVPHTAGRCIPGQPGMPAGSGLQRHGRSGRRPVRPATRSCPRPAGARRRTRPPRPVPRAVHRGTLECPARRTEGRPRARTRRSASSPRSGEEGRLSYQRGAPRSGSVGWEPRCRSPRMRPPEPRRGSRRAPPQGGQSPDPSWCAVRRRALAAGGASPAGFLASYRPSRSLTSPGRAPVGLSGYAIELHCRKPRECHHRLRGSHAPYDETYRLPIYRSRVEHLDITGIASPHPTPSHRPIDLVAAALRGTAPGPSPVPYCSPSPRRPHPGAP